MSIVEWVLASTLEMALRVRERVGVMGAAQISSMFWPEDAELVGERGKVSMSFSERSGFSGGGGSKVDMVMTVIQIELTKV